MPTEPEQPNASPRRPFWVSVVLAMIGVGLFNNAVEEWLKHHALVVEQWQFPLGLALVIAAIFWARGSK